MEVNDKDKTITLSIRNGINKPYLYRSKAYKRNDTATIEVDPIELTRLILEGKNINYEELPSEVQNLSFNFLGEELRQQVAIETFNTDIMKTLNLYSMDRGYNNAAAILADHNTFPGIDIAKFGESISVIHKRTTLANMSILEAYKHTVELYRDYYQYEEISEVYRKKVERIPETAFREAIANALIHRVWDLNSHIRISMFEDRIEVISPGGLPNGIREEEYLSGRISVLRNPIIGNVFYRLGIVEIFGTGITRITEVYKDSLKKPNFEVTANSIKVVLPVYNIEPRLSNEEMKIYELLSKTMPKSIREIMPYVTYGKTKVTKILRKMADEGIVKIEGIGRGTKYRL